MKKLLSFLILYSVCGICSIYAASANILPSVEFKNLSDKTQIDSVLVSVNGEPITLLDVILETAGVERSLAGYLTGERLMQETLLIRREAVEMIILHRLLYHEYLKKPFPIPPQEVESMIDKIAKEMGDGTRETLEAQLKLYGYSIEKLKIRTKKRIATETMLSYLCDRKVYITPKEVWDEYKAHPEKWSLPAKIELQLLQILHSGSKNPDPEKSVREIAEKVKTCTPQQFTNLVNEYSEGISAANNGMTGFMEMDKLRPEFAAVLKGKKSGDITGPVKTPEAWYFIRIHTMHPAGKIPFAKISQSIHRELMEKAWKENRKQFSDSLRQNAIIRYYFQK
ncbi:MAG: peptidylprolyl isomerase [Lentisphaeria bacterium]|nr:peptidylprolyl isomerase [Lentisphaeria bacterium]